MQKPLPNFLNYAKNERAPFANCKDKILINRME